MYRVIVSSASFCVLCKICAVINIVGIAETAQIQRGVAAKQQARAPRSFLISNSLERERYFFRAKNFSKNLLHDFYIFIEKSMMMPHIMQYII